MTLTDTHGPCQERDQLSSTLHKQEYLLAHALLMHVILVRPPQHYYCYNFFLPSTGGIRTSGQAAFYPQHCTVPKETPMDDTSRIAASLVTSIQRLRSEEERHLLCHTTALEKLADIFNKKTGEIPMMNNPTHPTSTQPTEPAIIGTAPRVHQHTTRANTPGMLP